MTHLNKLAVISLYCGLLAACQKSTETPENKTQHQPDEERIKATATPTVYVATAMTPNLIVGEPDRDTGILELGKDQCLYLKLDNGQRILPIITGVYQTPDQLNSRYRDLIGQRVNAPIEGLKIDLTISPYLTSSPGWVSSPPQAKCQSQGVTPRLYSQLPVAGEPVAANQVVNVGSSRQPISQAHLPAQTKPLNDQSIYMAFYNHPAYPADNSMTETGKLVVKDQCLYLELKDGQQVLPIFYTQGTHWQNGKNSLHAMDKDWNLNQRYQFMVRKNWDKTPVSKRPVFPESPNKTKIQYADALEMINAPNKSCLQDNVRYIYAIKG